MDSVKQIGMDVHKGAIPIAALKLLSQTGDGVHDCNQDHQHSRFSKRIAGKVACQV
jgi:hypothetical protein